MTSSSSAPPKYESYFLRPHTENGRDLGEIDRWVNSLPGRIVAIFNEPTDPSCLVAVTLRWM